MHPWTCTIHRFQCLPTAVWPPQVNFKIFPHPQNKRVPLSSPPCAPPNRFSISVDWPTGDASHLRALNDFHVISDVALVSLAHLWFSTWLFPFPHVHLPLPMKPMLWLLFLARLGFLQGCCHRRSLHQPAGCSPPQTVLSVCAMSYWNVGLARSEELSSSPAWVWAEVRSLVCWTPGPSSRLTWGLCTKPSTT